jgi:outer membrane receptor protein involved in Fe transport
MRKTLTALAALTAAGFSADAARGQDAAPAALQEITVNSTREDLQGIANSASEGIVTRKQISTRPLLRAGDVMESVPGLVATQHSGEGKANQYFLRGFNLDHGTDFATFVDGVPVNLPTHGHGHGYTDLYFLIPELVESIQYRKGPYYAEEGDFAAAGSARIRTMRRVPRPFAQIELGAGGYRRALVAGSAPVADGDWLYAAESARDDGPWTVRQHLHKTNLVTRYTRGTDANGWSLGLSHYEARWTATDQIPQRAIDSGALGRFDSLDPTTGGITQRTALNGQWRSTDQGRTTQINAYAFRYRFNLFSNFSYFTRGCDTEPLAAACNAPGPALDQFEQVDRRHVFGLSATHSQPYQWLGRDGQWTLGTDLRRDRIGEVGLYDTFARQRLDTVRSDQVDIASLGIWGQAELQIDPQWRATLGLRWDRRALDVASSVPENSGRRSASITSPKASLAWAPTSNLDVYANWGRGFHSNDARGSVIRVDPRDRITPAEAATPLVRATGYELGTRQKWAPGLVTTASLWALRLDSELLFVGDAGTTEAARASLRKGIELTANWQPDTHWEVDADLSLSRARFTDNDPVGNRIPGAMERVFTLGVTYASGPWTAGARLRHFGARPLLEDNTIRGGASTLVNTRLAYAVNRQVELSLEVFNLFDRNVNDIEYAYASRLRGEPAFSDGATPTTVHLHPAGPRSARIGVRYYF